MEKTMTKLFNIGTRVATRKVEGEPMVTGNIAAETTGTITHIEENTDICKQLGARFFLKIKLDEHNDNLDEWDNELHILIDAKHNDADECVGERLVALPRRNFPLRSLTDEQLLELYEKHVGARLIAEGLSSFGSLVLAEVDRRAAT
jgi:hypothetical protein